MTYKQTQTLGLNTNSRNITKIQPKIRIIHIYAPEIIKTDAANFRELVQRLTGKPTGENRGKCDDHKGKGKNKTRVTKKVNHGNVNTKLEVMMGSTNSTTTGSSSSPSSSCDLHNPYHQHFDDNGFWRPTTVDHSNNESSNNNSNINGFSNVCSKGTSGGFLSAFSDIDDHFDLSMFSLGANDGSSHHFHSLGEATQLSFRG